MKKILLLFLFAFISFIPSCFATYEESLSALEAFRYGRDFHNESISERLLRLEQDYFGLSQSGDISSRLDMLLKISQNDYPNQLSFEDSTYSRQKKKSKIRNIFKNLANSFSDSGMMTGFIPPITDYDNAYYNSSYQPNYYNHFYNAPKYSPNYIPPSSYNPHYIHQPIINDYNCGYSNSSIQYDRRMNPHSFNRDLYARSAVRILRD